MGELKIQRCELCDKPTGRSEDDSLYLETETGGQLIVCDSCHDEGNTDGTFD